MAAFKSRSWQRSRYRRPGHAEVVAHESPAFCAAATGYARTILHATCPGLPVYKYMGYRKTAKLTVCCSMWAQSPARPSSYDPRLTFAPLTLPDPLMIIHRVTAPLVRVIGRTKPIINSARTLTPRQNSLRATNSSRTPITARTYYQVFGCSWNRTFTEKIHVQETWAGHVEAAEAEIRQKDKTHSRTDMCLMR